MLDALHVGKQIHWEIFLLINLIIKQCC